MILSKIHPKALLLALSGFCCTVQAEDLLAVGTRFNQIFEQQANGEFTGLGVDILNRFAQQQKVTIHYQMTPWRRAQSMVERGQADILIGPYFNQARQHLLSFSAKAFYRDEIVFYARNTSVIPWNGDYESLKGLRIGKMLGWSYGELFNEKTQSLAINEFVDIKSGIERLSRGDLDLLATNVRNTEATLANIKIPQAIGPIFPLIDTQDGFMAFPKQAQFAPLKQQFDLFFEDMLQSGELANLSKIHRVTIPNQIPNQIPN
ncbi:substrate-binding periplasmic protein [Shewanella putrefaciens]|uniref:substrate-binding periplasmic protein n=1 Tax=Shewanella putrefaciens TaxID=24 RepID=UPI0018E8299F|nr:transporter substrate-binding domain-containing protein [Shewanella putrefaciens]